MFRSLELELFFPEELLADFLHLFYSIMLQIETFSVKIIAAEILIELLK